VSKEEAERLDDQGIMPGTTTIPTRSCACSRTDAVAAEIEFTGTNTGPMLMAGKEIPPTNETVTGRGIYIARVRGGEIAEFNSYPDVAGMMMQLGFMPNM